MLQVRYMFRIGQDFCASDHDVSKSFCDRFEQSQTWLCGDFEDLSFPPLEKWSDLTHICATGPSHQFDEDLKVDDAHWFVHVGAGFLHQELGQD